MSPSQTFPIWPLCKTEAGTITAWGWPPEK
jgi:hypothetical protein